MFQIFGVNILQTINFGMARLHFKATDLRRDSLPQASYSKDDGLIRPLSSSIRPRFYPCTGLHLPHPLSARTNPAAAGALLMSVDSVHIHSCIVA